MTSKFVPTTLKSALAAFCLATALHAGTPLICHPYAIGSAASLPGGNDYHGVSKNYDRTHVVGETLALLTPDKPIIVRMETLRRAAIYATAGICGWGADASKDAPLVQTLFAKLRERIDTATDQTRALAWFDYGFLAETLRNANWNGELARENVKLPADGYDFLQRAAASRSGDPEIEFALALASSFPKRADHADHLARARAGAKPGSLLAQNLATHFGGA